MKKKYCESEMTLHSLIVLVNKILPFTVTIYHLDVRRIPTYPPSWHGIESHAAAVIKRGQCGRTSERRRHHHRPTHKLYVRCQPASWCTFFVYYVHPAYYKPQQPFTPASPMLSSDFYIYAFCSQAICITDAFERVHFAWKTNCKADFQWFL